MNRYISGVRSKDSGFLQKISQKMLKVSKRFKSKEQVPIDLSEHKVHIEEHKPGFFQRLFKGKTIKEQEDIEETMQEGSKEVKEKMEEAVEEYETLEEVEDNIEHKKEGMFQRFMNIFKSKPNAEESEDVPVEQVESVISGNPVSASHHDTSDIKDDLKRISKITLSVMQKLSPEQQEAFKRNPEFAEYKKILEKHGLVKR